MKLYVASSWRNAYQPRVVQLLRSAGHEVYDFKNPPNGSGFGWREIDPNWLTWTPERWREALRHPRAVEGFRSDFEAMQWADACVLVLPSGRSAHLEAGWFAGAGKPVVMYAPQVHAERIEPDLMVELFGTGYFAIDLSELMDCVQALVSERAVARP